MHYYFFKNYFFNIAYKAIITKIEPSSIPILLPSLKKTSATPPPYLFNRILRFVAASLFPSSAARLNHLIASFLFFLTPFPV